MKNPPLVRRPAAAEITSVIGVEDRVRGELHVAGCARIDGVLRGSVERHGDRAWLVVGTSGHVRGDLRVHSVWIEGQVIGTIEATSHVEIAETATVDADIHYGTLTIAAGAQVSGRLYSARIDEES